MTVLQLLLLLILLLLLSSIFHIINKCDITYMYIHYPWLCTQYIIKWLFVDWYHFLILKINVTNNNTLKKIFNTFTILRNMRITISFLHVLIFDDKKFGRPKCHQTCWMSLIYWLSANHKPPLSEEDGKSQLWRKMFKLVFFSLSCTLLTIIVFMLICDISRNQTLIQ